MSHISVIRDELAIDPEGRGYSAMNAEQVAASFNTTDRPRNRTSISSNEILDIIVESEFNARSPVQRQEVWNILHLGDINPFGVAHTLFVGAFTPGGSATIAAFEAKRIENISRATELGLSKVKPGHVEEARR